MTEGTVEKPQLGQSRIIERPRLIRLLDESPARIKMLVAPAGYGKTTLARQWLAASPQSTSWFSATASSVDVAAFALGLHRAMSNAGFELGRASLDRLKVTADPQVDAEILAEVFAGDLRQWPGEHWLVIDDYQEITGAGAPERFIEKLLHTCPISLLLLTRERPSWASARRILYGEIAELDRDALAMNDDETRQLLIRDEDGSAVLFEASRGWPAAIALAAISSPRSHGVTIASDLHRFFAEDSYQSLDDSTRRGWWAISLVAPERADALTLMLDVQSAAVTLAVGHQQGFLTTAGRDVVEVHPLLRDFLEDKLRQEQPHLAEPLLTAAFEYLMKRRLWDKAFDLVHRFEWFHLISDLIREALQDLLSQGRTETLKRWVARSGPAAAEFAVGLASAELAFREGHYYASEILAKAAADSARTKDPDIELRALIAAGRAAHAACARARGVVAVQACKVDRDRAGTRTRCRHG